MDDRYLLLIAIVLMLTGVGMYWMSDPPLWGHALFALVAGGALANIYEEHRDG